MVHFSSMSSLLALLFLTMNSRGLLVQAISCQDALVKMMPCQPFLMGSSGITVPCCEATQGLNQMVGTNQEERKSVCHCFKRAAVIGGINVDRAKQIPKLCHIDLPTDLIDPNVDCDKLGAPTPATSQPNEFETDSISSISRPDQKLGPAASMPNNFEQALLPRISRPERLEPAASMPNNFEQDSIPKSSQAQMLKTGSYQVNMLQKLETHRLKFVKSANGCPPKGSILPKEISD